MYNYNLRLDNMEFIKNSNSTSINYLYPNSKSGGGKRVYAEVSSRNSKSLKSPELKKANNNASPKNAQPEAQPEAQPIDPNRKREREEVSSHYPYDKRLDQKAPPNKAPPNKAKPSQPSQSPQPPQPPQPMEASPNNAQPPQLIEPFDNQAIQTDIPDLPIKLKLLEISFHRSFEKLLGNQDFFLLYIFFMNMIDCVRKRNNSPYKNLQTLFNKIVTSDENIKESMQYLKYFLLHDIKSLDKKLEHFKTNGLIKLGWNDYGEFFTEAYKDEVQSTESIDDIYVEGLIKQHIVSILSEIREQVLQKFFMIVDGAAEAACCHDDDMINGGANKPKTKQKTKPKSKPKEESLCSIQ